MKIVSENKDTAVVVLSYNGKPYHKEFFPLLVSQAGEQYDVILIDNASTDDTLQYVQQNFPAVKTIRLEKNQGFTGGYIEGIKYIEGYKYLVLLSADFEVTENWLSPLHDSMEASKDLGACQPKIKYQRDKELFEYAGAAGGFMDSMGYFFCRGRIFNSIEADTGQYNQDIDCFWAGGGCIMIRKELYDSLGGLDHDLYAHMEEIDLCWRIRNAGFRVCCVTESTVYHVGGSVISYGSPQKTFRNFRNNLLIFVKNYHGIKFWPWLFARLILDGIAGFQLLIKGEFKNVLALIKAHFSFYYYFPKFWGKRRQTKKQVSDTPNTEGIYTGLIIWDYFIKGKKRFSELRFPSTSP